MGVRKRKSWLLGIAIWTIIPLLYASPYVVTSPGQSEEMTFLRFSFYTFPDWWCSGLLSVFALWAARRYPLRRDTWKRHVWILAACGLAFALVQMSCFVSIDRFLAHIFPGMGLGPLIMKSYGLVSFNFQDQLMRHIHWNLHKHFTIFWLIVAYAHGMDFYRKYLDRELRASQLEASLAKARLQMLRMQLNPHFLFNTLNAISALMHSDVDVADRMVARLSELLRISLDHSEEQLVPLKEELRFLHLYLEIEKTRFRDRLSVEERLDPTALGVPVPSLLIQPLVENAIKHGVAAIRGPGRIVLRAERHNGRLKLAVEDNGPGLEGNSAPKRPGGVGLANVRTRLKHIYGEDCSFRLLSNPGGGARAEIDIPAMGPEPVDEGRPAQS